MGNINLTRVEGKGKGKGGCAEWVEREGLSEGCGVKEE